MQNRGGPGPDETRNMLIAIGLSLAIFMGFQFFYEMPRQRELAAQERAQVEAQLDRLSLWIVPHPRWNNQRPDQERQMPKLSVRAGMLWAAMWAGVVLIIVAQALVG